MANMANDSDFILPLGDFQNEDTSSDEVVEVIPELLAIQLPSLTTTKSQAKASWVWNYFIKKRNEKGEMRAHCQFVINDNKKCTKSYKYDGSTGNLSSHIIKHGITSPIENFVENKLQLTTQSIQKHEQKEKEKFTLR